MYLPKKLMEHLCKSAYKMSHELSNASCLFVDIITFATFVTSNVVTKIRQTMWLHEN